MTGFFQRLYKRASGISDLTKYRLANIFGNVFFWGAIYIVYYQRLGLSESWVFWTVALAEAALVLAEYPTGVLGDVFSHKLSFALGNILIAVSYLFIAFASNLYILLIAGLIISIGTALRSGSNLAVLNQISKNPVKDLGRLRAEAVIAALVTTTVGPFLFKIDINLPLYFTALSFLISGLFVWRIKGYKHTKIKKGNIFATARKGLRYSMKEISVIKVILLTVPLAFFVMNLTWFSNPIFIKFDIDTRYWGILVSLSVLMQALGGLLTSINTNYKWFLLSFFIFVLLMASGNIWLTLIGFLLVKLPAENINSTTDANLAMKIPSDIKASVLSFKSLVHKLISAIFLALVGYFYDILSLRVTIMVLFAVFLLLTLFSLGKNLLDEQV
jgi:MFS family permease